MKILDIQKVVGKRVVGGSLPDIDFDVPSLRRNDVKKYIEHRFGENQVCSVGTYQRLQLKAAIKDLGNIRGLDFEYRNRISSYVEKDVKTVEDLFKQAVSDKAMYEFMQEHPDIINDIITVLGTPKARSVHASATMIMPSEKTMFEWTPIKVLKGENVSEFEGTELEDSGFLKEDVLGLAQLDKINEIVNLCGDNINVYDITFDDPKVFEYISKGWNSDVFQIDGAQISKFMSKLMPENFSDIVAGISLYRPGPKDNGFHEIYQQCKNEGRRPEYMWGCKDITKHTYGIFVYQEQIMQACVTVGGLTLAESDDVRKAMGKKKIAVLLPFKEQFIAGAGEKGCDNETAEKLWDTLTEFAKYGFNLSHATVYGALTYISQWFKVHHPVEFWVTALKWANKKQIPNFISEIIISGGLPVMPADINISGTEMQYIDGKIYWGLGAIKGVGKKAIEQLDNEASICEYSSMSDFLNRHIKKGSSVNKTVIESLITSGSFDALEKIESPKERIRLIKWYRDNFGVKVDKSRDLFTLNEQNLDKNWWWLLQQKNLSGMAKFDYCSLVDYYSDGNYPFLTPSEIQQGGSKCYIAGVVIEAVERNTKKGKMLSMKIESNYEFINVVVWADTYAENGAVLKDLEGTILIMSGEIKNDTYNQCRSLYSMKDSEFINLK